MSADEFLAGLDNPERFRLFRLCDCPTCEGKGKAEHYPMGPHGERILVKCSECRGEGRTRVELATCETPEAVGVALVTLAREDEWKDADGNPCALGLLERGAGKNGAGRWLILPWAASPRNVRDAARTLAKSKNRQTP